MANTYLSTKIFLNGGGEHVLEGSSNSNLRLTELANCDGRIAIGDIERLVANDLRVGDGDNPYGKRNPDLYPL